MGMSLGADPIEKVPPPSWAPKTNRSGRTLGRTINVDGAIAQYGEDAMQMIFDGFLTCDEPAMAVVDHYSRMQGGHRLMMEHLNKALEEGIGAVEGAAPPLVALFEQLDAIPDWVDWDQLHRGAIAYFRPGKLVSLTLTCAAIAAGNYGYGVTRPQALTGRFEDKAKARANETFRWLLAATEPGGMKRDKEGFKLTARVRVLHAFVRHMVTSGTRWDWDNWGSPICDSDVAWEINGTFTSVPLRAYKKIGIRFSRQELEDIYALFRYIGYLLGGQEHLIGKTVEEFQLLDDQWVAVDLGPDEGCILLVHSLLDIASKGDGDPKNQSKLMPPARTLQMLYGMCRYWAGDKICDGLKIPNTKWRYMGHLIKPFVVWKEWKRATFGGDDAKLARDTRDTFLAGVTTKAGETTIATPKDVEEGIHYRNSLAANAAAPG